MGDGLRGQREPVVLRPQKKNNSEEEEEEERHPDLGRGGRGEAARTCGPSPSKRMICLREPHLYPSENN